MAAHPLEEYLRDLRDFRRSGSAVPETSYYPALARLLDSVGATLKPKVRCIVNPSHGAGIRDVGLFTPDQFQKASAHVDQFVHHLAQLLVNIAKTWRADPFSTAGSFAPTRLINTEFH